MPWKDFSLDIGEQLTTGDIMRYLMSQAIITCTSSTRPDPVRVGMRIWETDLQCERVWTGTTWRFLRGLNKFIRKTSDETLSSSTTMQDDDQLQVNIVANGVYVMECYLIMNAGLSIDWRLSFDTPFGTYINWASYSPYTNQTDFDRSTIGIFRFTPGGTADLGGFGMNGVFRPRGIIKASTTSGLFKLRWAQQTSSATAITMKANSWMYLRRVS